MAEFRTQASFAFRCSNAEMALLEEAFLAAANLAYGCAPDPPPPELLAIFPPTGDDVWSRLRGVFADPAFPILGVDLEGSNTLHDPTRCAVNVYGTTDVDPGAVALLIQRCCPESLEQAPVGFGYCWSCSKPRVGAFGGGLWVIHPDRIDSGTTGEALAAALRG